MPVTFLNIEWPNENIDSVYSPSSIIQEYFSPGESLSVSDFKEKCLIALDKASDRVRAKYGYACTSAMGEAERISDLCGEFDEEKVIKILSIKG